MSFTSGNLEQKSHLQIESELALILMHEDYYQCEKSLYQFIKSAWPILEPGRPFMDNWHIGCIAEHLEACYYGQITKLLINMPPRNLKSISVSVCFPVWSWLKNPMLRFFCAAYAESLSTKHSVDRRDLIRSAWFQLAWSERFSLVDDQDQKTFYKNNHRGQMFSTSVGGAGTGEGGDILIVDDPINPKEAASEKLRERANTWRDQTLSTRKNDKKTAREIIVMQRLHENDLSGYVLNKDKGWVHLKLEGHCQQTRTITYPRSGKRKEFNEGEFLHPSREGAQEHAQMLLDLGGIGYQSQIQQDPKPASGGLFKRAWWKRYDKSPSDILETVQFVDCAQKPGITNDWTIIATWVRANSGYYLLDLWRGKVEAPELEAIVVGKYQAFVPNALVIEDKSAGQSLIQYLQRLPDHVIPVIPFNPMGDKEVRATAATPTVQAGKCHLPNFKIMSHDESGVSYDLIEAFISEHERFPRGAHDDMVDTTSMMVKYFATRSTFKPRIRSL